MDERLQKIMAQAGLGSRRDCEEYIIAGRVRVNGAVAVIGQKANPSSDKITLDGRAVKPAEQKVYIALHKPRYVLSTVEPEQGDSRQTVRDLIPVSERLYPVGRLDFESEGLVLMTNDGDLAQKLTHPSHGHSKEYRVLLARQPDEEQLSTWRRGVVLEDGYKTQSAEIKLESLAGKGAWLRIVMREGRKRQIREIGAILALPVVRILRVRIGNLLLGALKPGEWRYLTSTEIVALKEDRPGLPPFPDMTRKKPLGAPRKFVRKPSDTPTDKPASGRTKPPAATGAGKPAERRKPEGGYKPSAATGAAKPAERRKPEGGYKSPSASGAGKPAARRRPEGGPKPPPSATSAGKPAERRKPTGGRKPPSRKSD